MSKAKRKGKGGPREWSPATSALGQDISLPELYKNVELARGPGLQALEEVAINVLGVAPSTLFAYLKREPESELSKVLTRARYRRVALIKGKASAIANNDEHPRQSDMIKFLLGRLGGAEFQNRFVLEPAKTVAEAPVPRKIKLNKAESKALAAILKDAAGNAPKA